MGAYSGVYCTWATWLTIVYLGSGASYGIYLVGLAVVYTLAGGGASYCTYLGRGGASYGMYLGRGWG